MPILPVNIDFGATQHQPSLSFGLMDDLAYTYKGNRVIGVNDAVPDIANNGGADFSDGAATGTADPNVTSTHELLHLWGSSSRMPVPPCNPPRLGEVGIVFPGTAGDDSAGGGSRTVPWTLERPGWCYNAGAL